VSFIDQAESDYDEDGSDWEELPDPRGQDERAWVMQEEEWERWS
jgi:hypothetical protein